MDTLGIVRYDERVEIEENPMQYTPHEFTKRYCLPLAGYTRADYRFVTHPPSAVHLHIATAVRALIIHSDMENKEKHAHNCAFHDDDWCNCENAKSLRKDVRQCLKPFIEPEDSTNDFWAAVLDYFIDEVNQDDLADEIIEFYTNQLAEDARRAEKANETA